ncbi:MAG TPA: PepSY-associated TM helix domain-containing protein [Sphingomonas sp.]|nr:PepSY-associated TM helix domain-containing protein [Sphingomonas sp.]
MASRRLLRTAWWQIHKWIGLILMIVLIPLGLSGVVLAWDDAIDHALHPQRFAVQGTATLPPSAYARAARLSLRPDERLSQIRYPRGEGPVVVSAIATPVPPGQAGGARRGPPQRVTLWLDPGSARVLDIDRGGAGLVRIAHDFHGMLFIPGGVGRALVGLLGIAMFLMAAGGVWLWWPPVGGWIKGMRWQRGDRRLDTNLHHRVGFWIALPLAAQAFTGAWLAWPQVKAVAGLAAPHVGPMERARMVPVAAPALSPDQALAAARAATPGTPASVAWPVGEDAPWRIQIRAAQDTAESLVDDRTSAVHAAPLRGDGGLALAMRHYHDGTTLGPVWRALLVLLGLAPTLLGITGLLMWLRGRRWRAEAARRQHGAREPVAAA